MSYHSPDEADALVIADLWSSGYDELGGVMVGTATVGGESRAFTVFNGLAGFPDPLHGRSLEAESSRGCCVVPSEEGTFVAVSMSASEVIIDQYVTSLPGDWTDPAFDGSQLLASRRVHVPAEDTTVEAMLMVDSTRVLLGGWRVSGGAIEPWLGLVDLDDAVSR